MSDDTARERRLFWLLLLGVGVLAFWQLGRLPLLDVDEPVYGQVGKEMARGAGWLTPHYNGGLWFDKPPLFYWLTGLSMRLLGVSEFAARLPSALLAVVLVAVTCALARRCFPQSPRAALWSGFVLATTVQFFLLARAAVTDMTLAATLTTALLGIFAWLETQRGRWMALAGLMTGLAVLTKGPVAVVLVGIQVIAYLLLTRQWKRLGAPALWGGFALCLLVALPWYVAMIRLHGSLFVQGFLEANNVTRFLKPEHQETQQFWFYVPVLAGFFLPWTLALPTAVAGAIRNIRAERREPDSPQPTLFLTLWFVLVFVFFSVSQTKLITYIFPIFPCAAILVGRAIEERIHAGTRDRIHWAFGALLLLLALALTIVGHKFGVPPVTLALWAVALGGGAILAVALPPSGDRWAAPGAAFALMLLIAWASPAWKTHGADVSDRNAALAAARATPPGGTFYALGLKHPSLVYYSDRRVVFSDDRARAMQDMATHLEHVYALGPRVLDDLRDRYGLHDYRVLYAKPRLTVIQAVPHVAATPRRRTENTTP